MTDTVSEDAPNYPRIWLQPFAGEQGSHTWCQDRQSDEDIEYVRADLVPKPEEHETCALCGLPAPDGYVEFDADGEAMHPHCRAAATKPPLAGEVRAQIVAMVDGTSPMSKWVGSVDYSTYEGFEEYLKAQLRDKLNLKVSLDKKRHDSPEDESLATFVDGASGALEAALATYRTVRSRLAGRGEGFVLVPVEPLEELSRLNDVIMDLARSGSDVSVMEEELGEATAIVIKAYRRALASRPKENPHAK